jgi:hypothetical protein
MADALLVIGTLVIAGTTALAAAAAWRAAVATRRTTEANLFSQLMSEYASAEMEKALNLLANQRDLWLADPEERTFQALVENWARIFVSKRQPNELNNARRRVSHFYQKASRLIDEDLVSGGLREELLHLSGRDLMHDIVIPLDRALAKQLGTDVAGDDAYLTRFILLFPVRCGFPTSAVPSDKRVDQSSAYVSEEVVD